MSIPTLARPRRRTGSDVCAERTPSSTVPRGTLPRDKPSSSSRPRTAPSLAVLTMLATLCAESVVAIPPAAYRCPNFLCPFLTPATTSSLLASPPLPPSPASVSHPISKRKPELARRSLPNGKDPQKLPTKYLKGQDGRYRPESSWSLHGQTLTCDWVTPSPSAVDQMDNVDTPVSPAGVGLPQNSALANSSATSTQPPDDLPSGWASPAPRSGFYRVPVIVVFALTLTLFITVLIASCALLRRKRRLRRLSLLQKEVSSELEEGPDEANESTLSRRSRKHKRVWTRSSARWKSNPLSCRRRRVRSSNHPSVTSINTPERSLGLQPGPDTVTEIIEEPAMEEVTTSRLTSLPPAYPSRSTNPTSSDLTAQRSIEQTEAQQPKDFAMQDSAAPAMQETMAQSSTSAYGAHLAIDDKAVLERLASNASSPHVPDLIATSPHVPEWFDVPEEEELFESPIPTAPQFPLPGCVVEPTAPSVYDDPEEFRPMRLLPSSPILDDLRAVELPSAPPMDS